MPRRRIGGRGTASQQWRAVALDVDVQDGTGRWRSGREDGMAKATAGNLATLEAPLTGRSVIALGGTGTAGKPKAESERGQRARPRLS